MAVVAKETSDQSSNEPHSVSPLSLVRAIRLRHLGMAFFWACSMLTFRSSSLLDASLDVPLYSTILVLTSFAFNIATMVIMSAKNIARPGWIERIPFSVILVIIEIGLCFLSIFESVMGGVYFYMAGAVLVGIGYGCFWGSWAEVYARIHSNITSLALPLSYILTLVLFLACTTLIDSFSLPALAVMAPLPVCSFVLLMRCRKKTPFVALRTQLVDYGSAVARLWPLLIGAGVLSFVFGFMWEMSIISMHTVTEVHATPLTFTIPVVCALTVLILFGRRRWDLSLAYRYTAPIVAAIVLALPLFFLQSPVTINVILNVGFAIFEVLLWTFTVDTAFDLRVSGFVVGAIGRCVFLIARLVGMVFAYFLLQLSSDIVSLYMIASIIMLYLLASWLYLSARKPSILFAQLSSGHTTLGMHSEEKTSHPLASSEPSERMSALSMEAQQRDSQVPSGAKQTSVQRDVAKWEQEVPDCPQDQATHSENTEDVSNSSQGRMRFKMRCELVTERYRLTRREAELLPYLAQGRSARVIADTLFISENTVRTHIKHVIEKTGVASKEALIDLVDTIDKVEVEP